MKIVFEDKDLKELVRQAVEKDGKSVKEITFVIYDGDYRCIKKGVTVHCDVDVEKKHVDRA